MGSVGTSGALTRSSLAVVRRRAPLLAIPLAAVAAAALTAVGALTLGRLSLAPQVREFGSAYRTTGFGLPGPSGSAANTVTTIVPTPLTGVVVVGAALVLALTGAYASAAVTAAAHAALTGRRASLPRALGIAFLRAPQLLGWVVFGALVGVPQRLLEKRPILGVVPARLTGIGWRWAAWLGVPVIVVEGATARRALRRSGTLVAGTWGPHVAPRTGLGWLGAALALPGLAVAVGLGPVVGPAAVALGAVLVAAAMAVAATVSSVARTALYLHTTGHAVPGFDAAVLAAAFPSVAPFDPPRRAPASPGTDAADAADTADIADAPDPANPADAAPAPQGPPALAPPWA